MKRAALIITDASVIRVTTPDLEPAFAEFDPSEQLLADLRTLARFPDLLRLADDPPSILETPVTVSNADLLAAFEAQDRVRALLPEEEA
jgi:hypothetical protein